MIIKIYMYRKVLLLILGVLLATATIALALSNTNENESGIVLGPSGNFIAAHGKDITFYNASKINCWFRLKGADWIYYNGTIVFKRTSDIVIETARDLKGTVWICTYYGWNPLKGKVEYYKDEGYCYITSLKYGKATIPAAKLVPGVKYTLRVQLIDSSWIFKHENDNTRSCWIDISDPSTFDRVEIYGFGPIGRTTFHIIVK